MSDASGYARIEHPYAFLVKNGFIPQTATNMANSRVGHVKPKQIERLCLLLNCTPNDLFDWRPDKDSVVPDTHALHSITRTQKAKAVADLRQTRIIRDELPSKLTFT
ncbi:MAG: helix-turn-helix domain-containing protein [Pyrinomonadaceae bacterium]